MSDIWNFTHKTPNPRWGGVGLIFFNYFSLQFMTFPGLLIFWPPKIPTAIWWGGGDFFIDFLDSSWNLKFPLRPPPGWEGLFTGLLKCWPPTPPGVGWVKNKFYWFSGQFMTFPGLLKFWPPTPPEPPGVGWVKNKFYWFSGQFMTFPGLLIFWPPKIPTATPFGGGGYFFINFFDSSWNLKFPLRPPPLGGKVYFF